MFMKMVNKKIKATGMNLIAFEVSSLSTLMYPRRFAAWTTITVPMSCAKRMKEGAGSKWMANLLEIRRHAEQSMYPPTAKGVLAKNPPAMIVDRSRNYGKQWNN